MKISELPKKIRKKALKYQINEIDCDHFNKKTDDLNSAFNWRDTKECFNYWSDLNNKKSTKEQMKDTIVESVIEQFKQRSEVGINKYGVTLDREDLTMLEWLKHLQEELMDATLYIEKLKSKLNFEL